MSSEVVIKVENLSKRYHIYDQPHDRLKQFILPRLQGMAGMLPKQYFREFWALKDVSFEVKKGETVGIIGRNGSGKSTLLQMICGTLNPTGGSIQTHGRIAALLELGSGFNPEFTGRENIYMNGTVLGLSKGEIDHKFDTIASFADIGEFIEQPVKTYSSGMVVRLAFAVQSQVDPDILIVDEALSVGDAKFQLKCFERLRQLKENGTSILLVTHSGEQIVTHCSSAILLSEGNMIEAGQPRRVVNRYMDLLFGKDKEYVDEDAQFGRSEDRSDQEKDLLTNSFDLSLFDDRFAERHCYNPYEYRWGDRSASIIDFYLAANNDPYPSTIISGQQISLAISIKFFQEMYCPILGITIKTKEGVTVYGANSETLKCDDFLALGVAESIVQAKINFICRLAPGDYFISLGVATRRGEDIVPHDRRYDSIHLHVQSNKAFVGFADLDATLSADRINV